MEEAPIDNHAGTGVFTVIYTVFDVAGLPETQAALEVTMHFTSSASLGVNVNVLALGPAVNPL